MKPSVVNIELPFPITKEPAFPCPQGFTVDTSKLALHHAAIKYQTLFGVDYSEALDRCVDEGLASA